MNVNDIKWDENGLVPAVVQDFATKQVLTLAYMNAQSLEITLEEGFTCFFSRSKQQLWRKGETSGNRQRVMSITADCDCDALLILAVPQGPACHTGEASCFHRPLQAAEGFDLATLYSTIIRRKNQMPPGAYTTYLFDKGCDKILKKVGEEAAEVIIAAKNPGKEELIYELSDLVYHSFVLMAEKGVTPAEVMSELARRHQPDEEK